MKLFDLYIKSSLHVALSVTCFAWITLHEFGVPASIHLISFIFFSTVVSYNGIKYVHLLNRQNVPFTSELLFILGITLLSVIGLTGSAVQLSVRVLFASAALGIITLTYGLPLHRRFENLRQIYGLKIVIIALVWSGGTVLLPLLHANFDLFSGPEFTATFIQRFLIVIALTIPFDIRDRLADPDSLGTIPMIIGNRNAVILGSLLLAASAMIEFTLRGALHTSPYVFISVLIVTGSLLWKSIGHQGRYLASFWIEGIPVFWALILLLLSSHYP